MSKPAGLKPEFLWRHALALLILVIVAGCATLPPGHDFPKTQSTAFDHPEDTQLGKRFAADVEKHGGNSGYRMLQAGIEGFAARVQMLGAAEHSIDLQYYVFREDQTGQLLTDAVLHAADRGVRVRILIDDVEKVDGDERIAALDAHPNIEVRIFNPFAYRGTAALFRAVEFAVDKVRLDYRMHNKLFLVDNAVGLVGGRNIGDQYFQIDPGSQFGDDDIFAAGPIVKQLSTVFDKFWNCSLAIPVEALDGKAPATALEQFRRTLAGHRREKRADGADYEKRVLTGEPLAGLLEGKLPLVWSAAQLVYDSPEKRRVVKGEAYGVLINDSVAAAAAAVEKELIVVTPFFVPGKQGMDLFNKLRARDVAVRVLTNSLEATPEIAAQSGYMHYRVPLLEQGVQLYEIRALLASTRGSGETPSMAQYGNYALHAKLFVFDRRQVFVGSMNFDERSMQLNTEIGLLIDSPELAQQTAARFEAMTQPAESYTVLLRKEGETGREHLVWRTAVNGQLVEYKREPARDVHQRLEVRLLSLLPLDKEL